MYAGRVPPAWLPWIALLLQVGVYLVGMNESRTPALALLLPAWAFSAYACITLAKAKGYAPWLGAFCAVLGLLIGPLMVIALPPLPGPARTPPVDEAEERPRPEDGS